MKMSYEMNRSFKKCYSFSMDTADEEVGREDSKNPVFQELSSFPSSENNFIVDLPSVQCHPPRGQSIHNIFEFQNDSLILCQTSSYSVKKTSGKKL